ncbi:signal peptidase I [Cetobacterium sp. 2A]|uniref:signal peptidase I n=1 Tax=Cetobacterium sp. 2A TaxID=2754723 RepID=UPI00163B7152|nr:signal peptidase I [Cetobacterium sp. 2A]MBC2856381.1 signal peptidase I [Cetobacterium sp. 2A]
MSRENFIFNTIFYVILTSFFIYIFVREKYLVAKIKIYKDRFSEWLIKKLKVEGKTLSNVIRKTVNFVESIGTALILVLIIQKFYLGNFLVPTGSMIPTIIPKDRLFGNMVIYKFKEPKREDIIVFQEPIQNKVLYTKRAMGLPGEEVNIKYGYLYINGNKIAERHYSDLGAIGNDVWTVPKKGDTVEIVPGLNYSDKFKEKSIDIAEVQKYLLENPGSVSEVLPDVEFILNGKKTGMILDLIHNKENLDKIIKGEKVTVVLDEDYYMALGDNTDGSYDSRMWGFVKDSRIQGKAFFRFWPLNRIGLLD